jgi:hypothetical protein
MRKGVLVFGFTMAAAVAPDLAQAVPAFARRYEVGCHFCHDTGYPKLTSQGQRFKERGFRMSREDAFDFGAWARSLPVDARLDVRQSFGPGEDATSAFLKPVFAGSLGRRVSFWIDTGLRLASGEDDTVTHTRPDNAWARVDVVPEGRLYVKGGRFELDLPFTQVRTPHLFPYEIYEANTGFETDTIGSFQDGVEVGGDLPRDVHWSAAVVAGRDPVDADAIDPETGRFDGNLFLRIAKRVGQHRVGGFAYVARNVLAPEAGQRAEDNVLRIGVDGSAWISRVNLSAVVLYGRNDNSVVDGRFPRGTEQALGLGGAFLQGDWHLGDYVVVSLRGEAVSRAPGRTAATRQTFTDVAPGVQFFLRERLRFAVEYVFRNAERADRGAAQVDVAF